MVLYRALWFGRPQPIWRHLEPESSGPDKNNICQIETHNQLDSVLAARARKPAESGFGCSRNRKRAKPRAQRSFARSQFNGLPSYDPSSCINNQRVAASKLVGWLVNTTSVRARRPGSCANKHDSCAGTIEISAIFQPATLGWIGERVRARILAT